ncbi:hypothetical protein DMA11_22330 [Marinilabiliaceae bacterium JC017]|nr:hypothetical protein DMA11_22330 [Marinilabiliaceae bacterium JC017]
MTIFVRMAGIRDIKEGRLMVVSDIHGNEYDFNHILKRFFKLKEKGEVDLLVFLGDLIHSFNPSKDASLAILDRLIELGANEDRSAIICLVGNHELVHILQIPLRKGRWEFNKGLEWKMAGKREKYISFFQNMPIAIRTGGGVLINHTGAARYYNKEQLQFMGLHEDFLKEIDYNNIIEKVRPDFTNGIHNRYDVELGYDIMERPQGQVLWETFMNGNEHQYGIDEYHKYIIDTLHYFNDNRPGEKLDLLVSGHIGVPDGVERIGEKQLRICSSAGCSLDLEKKLLMLDAAKIYTNLDALCSDVREVY